jgi:hypothetical protein
MSAAAKAVPRLAPTPRPAAASHGEQQRGGHAVLPSLETTSAQWTRGSSGPTAGARFKGTNQMGSKKWRSDCVVTACVPGKRFAFDVKAGPFQVARWAYDFAPTGPGCLVTELREDHPGALMTWMPQVITGTKDRARRNQET